MRQSLHLNVSLSYILTDFNFNMLTNKCNSKLIPVCLIID